MKCDFCSAPPVWLYRAHSFECDYEAGAVHALSEGDWLACDACHELIRADRRNDLVGRALVELAERHGIPVSVLAPISRPSLAAFHRRFFDARFGPPVRLEGS